jgi:arylsulfatase A-like enzyme
VLADHGYRTGAISANTLVFSRSQGFAQGFDHFSDSFFSATDAAARTFFGGQFKKRVLTPLGWTDHAGRRRAENVTVSALEWVAADQSRPFFLVLNYFDMHDPYMPPAPWRGRFSTVEYPGGRLNGRLGRPGELIALTPQEIREEIDAYDGAIAYADHWFGNLLQGLTRLGMLDDTIIVATSDHGESFGEQGLFGHGTSLRVEQIHVPLILRYPPGIRANAQVNVPVGHVSLPNTLLELAGIPTRLPSVEPSLSAFFRGGSTTDWPAPVAELAFTPWQADVPKCGAARSILDGRYHVIDYDRCDTELFDVATDPGERTNLAADSLYRPVVERLESVLDARLTGEVRP